MERVEMDSVNDDRGRGFGGLRSVAENYRQQSGTAGVGGPYRDEPA